MGRGGRIVQGLTCLKLCLQRRHTDPRPIKLRVAAGDCGKSRPPRATTAATTEEKCYLLQGRARQPLQR